MIDLVLPFAAAAAAVLATVVKNFLVTAKKSTTSSTITISRPDGSKITFEGKTPPADLQKFIDELLAVSEKGTAKEQNPEAQQDAGKK